MSTSGPRAPGNPKKGPKLVRKCKALCEQVVATMNGIVVFVAGGAVVGGRGPKTGAGWGRWHDACSNPVSSATDCL